MCQHQVECSFRAWQRPVGYAVVAEAPHALRDHRDPCAYCHEREHRVHTVRLLRNLWNETRLRTQTDHLQVETLPLGHGPQDERFLRQVGNIELFLSLIHI